MTPAARPSPAPTTAAGASSSWAAVKQRFVRSSKQFVKFAIVGGSGTIVNLIVLKLCLLGWAQISSQTPFRIEILASAIAFLVAVVNNYLLNRWWTFRSSGPAHLEFGKFLAVSLAGLGLNTLAFSIFRGHLDLPVLISQVLAIGCVLPFNFVLNKFWSFRQR